MAKKKGIGSPGLIHSANDTGRDFIKGNFIDVTKDYGETFHKLGYGRMFKNFGLGNDDLVTMSDEFGYGLLHGLSKEESLLNGLNKVRGYWQDRVDGKSLSGVGFSKDQKAEAQRLLNVTKGTYINYSEKADRVKAKRERYNQLKEKYRTSPTQDDRIEENKSLVKSSKKSVERHRQKRAPGKNSRRGSKYTYAMERAGEEKRAAHAASQRKAALKANAGAKRWRSIKGKFGKIAGAITSLIDGAGKKVSKIIKPEAKRKYAEAEALSGSKLEEIGPRPSASARHRDTKIRNTAHKYKGYKGKTLDEEGQKDFLDWLGNEKRSLYSPDHPELYAEARQDQLKDKHVRKSIERHNAKKKKIEEARAKKAAPDAAVVADDAPVGTETKQGPIVTQTGGEPSSGKPTENQKKAGATKGDATIKNQEDAGASSGSGDDSYDAKLKALRKKGRANEYAADRIEQERKQVIDMINEGNYKDAASAMGYSGEYTAEHADKLRQAAEKHAMDAVNEGAGIMDYVNAYHVPGAIGGAAILAGTGVALMDDNGRKSNEQLYSSPF